MAFATAETQSRILAQKREMTATQTLVTRADVEAKLAETKTAGFARTRNSMEDGVASVAMPFFFDSDDPAGAISIALPDTKLTDARCGELIPVLKDAVDRLESTLTGQVH
jgi:DNA-binding IclR family transcriptional regulator